jgi:PadR family transcriptional regulator PadR
LILNVFLVAQKLDICWVCRVARRQNISPQTRAVLAILAAQSATWRYGYELTRLTGLTSGTLYPLLKRLHDQAMLDEQWAPSTEPGRPPRHAYRLTRQGLSLARHLSVAFKPFNPKLKT